MILEGERLKSLVQSANGEIMLCAPFVKTHVIATLFDVAPPDIPLKIVTRWRPEEVAAGVSDLEVYDLVQGRSGASLMLLDQLHAKLYLSDDRCLIGSANLTGSALGWSNRPNLELLVEVNRSDPNVQGLLSALERAEVATHTIKDEIAEKAEALGALALLSEEYPDEEDAARFRRPWLPRCAAPDKLFEIYENPNTDAVTLSTRSDGLSDLKDLGVFGSVEREEFLSQVAKSLLELKSIKSVIERIPEKLSDDAGLEIVSLMCPDFSRDECRKQWLIVRDWINVFFADRYEVAPTEFELRLRP